MPFVHEYPQSSLVRLKQNGEIVGLGLLVDDEHVLTCAHVVSTVVGLNEMNPDAPTAFLSIDFPYIRKSCQGQVIYWKPPRTDEYAGEIDDIALISLGSKKPPEAMPTPLTRARILPGNQFEALGYPQGYEDSAVTANGVIKDIILPSGRLQIESFNFRGIAVQRGFSGTPVWNEELNGVVGIVVASLKRDNVAFIIPTQELRKIWPELPLSPPPLMDVPSLPEQFVNRPKDLAKIKGLLLKKVEEQAGYQKVAILGMVGSGKSILAKALVLKDQDVQQFFSDGIFWISLGREAGPNLLQKQLRLAKALGDTKGFLDVGSGIKRLKELLSDRTTLIILDDLWQHNHFQAFNSLGPSCKMMVTTRDLALVKLLDIETHNFDTYNLGLLEYSLSSDVLFSYARQKPDLSIERELIEECGKLPLALAMVGGMVRCDPELQWRDVLDMLKCAELQEINMLLRDYDDYPINLLKVIQISVTSLAPEEQSLYSDFAVFPEDTSIPVDVLKIFWIHCGLREYLVHKRLNNFVDRSLAFQDKSGQITLHILQYDYVKMKAKDHLKALHDGLVEAYRKACLGVWATGPNDGDDGYFFQHLP